MGKVRQQPAQRTKHCSGNQSLRETVKMCAAGGLSAVADQGCGYIGGVHLGVLDDLVSRGAGVDGI